MPVCTVWIIAQQDGEHLLEYDLMLRSIVKSRYQLQEDELQHIRFLVFYYQQERRLASVLELIRVDSSVTEFKIREKFAIRKELDVVQSDIYDERTLTNFFTSFNDSAPEHKNIVILWGHGNGLGIGFFYNESTNPAVPNPSGRMKIRHGQFELSRNANKALELITQLGTVLSYPHEALQRQQLFSKGDSGLLLADAESKWSGLQIPLFVKERLAKFLSADQLSRILRNGLGKKADILLVNSCYMQMIESSVYFKDSVEIIVASQSTFPFLGLNFEEIVPSIQAFAVTGSITPGNFKNVAKAAVLSLIPKYDQQPFVEILKDYYSSNLNYNVKTSVALSAIQLTNLDSLLLAINDLGKYFSRVIQADGLDQIVDARLKCATVIEDSVYDLFIDLENFLTQYDGLTNDSDFEAIYGQFKRAVVEVKIENKLTPGNLGFPNLISFIMPFDLEPLNKELNEIIRNMVAGAFSAETTLGVTIPNWGEFMLTWFESRLK